MDYRQQCWINLQQWYRKPLGIQFADAEATTLAHILPELFGYHILCVGYPSGRDLLAHSPIARRYYADLVSPPVAAGASIWADPRQLPVSSDSIDVVVAAHTLELGRQPQQVLKELERILIAEGRLIVLGFNPLSSWGILRLLRPNYAKRAGWGGHLCSVSRLRTALAALGFDVMSVNYPFLSTTCR